MPVTDPRYSIPRDLQGYGPSPPNPHWPNNSKVCISFILNYEEGAERTVLNGDGHSEPYLWEKGASSSYLTGHRHAGAESEYEYGSRSGSWRILRLFKEMNWKFTVWAVAQAMEKNPLFGKECVKEGHEIAAHGLRWLDISEMGVQEEKEYIKENCLSLERVTGRFPRGYFYGRGTPNTRGLWPEVMREMGRKLLYCSESFNDDLPYWVDLPYEKDLKNEEKEGMLVVPYNYDCNDGKFHMSPGFTGISDYTTYLKSTFNMLYREGRSGTPKMMNVPIHSRIIGKPGRSEMLRDFMLYVKEKEGVWVATRKEIAEHFKETYPYVPGMLAPGYPTGGAV